MSSLKNLIWLDMEMTGLNIQEDHILEIAIVITDLNLNIIAESPDIIIQQSEPILAAMDEWNTSHHSKSGLVELCLKSRISIREAEQQALNFVKKYSSANSSPMCGNSICQDRRFLARIMPAFESFFHYRNLDVSTIKLLFNAWTKNPTKSSISKQGKHRAKDDILESIGELIYYRNNFFILDR